MSEVDTFLVRERDRFEEFGSDNEFTTTVDGKLIPLSLIVFFFSFLYSQTAKL